MKQFEEILLGGVFKPSEQNCPTREGELIESLDKIHDIPNPRVGMRVYVENTGKEYIIKSLKAKIIGGVNVPGAAVNDFEETVNYTMTDKNVCNLFMLEDNANKSMYVGKFTNLNNAFARCAVIGKENPTLSILKFDIVSGNIYDSLFIMQTYNRNDSIITQFFLYGEGHKHSCKVRHIVTNGMVDDWQNIQLFTSYSYENGTLYGYKYGRGEGDNKVAIASMLVDVTDAIRGYGLTQKTMKEGVVYKAVLAGEEMPELDTGGKIRSHINSKKTRLDDKVYLYIKIENNNIIIDCNIHTDNGVLYYKYTITDYGSDIEKVLVSADMTQL